MAEQSTTPTIEEIRKAIDMVDRSGGEYYPSSELAVYYIRVLFAELKKRDNEIERLKERWNTRFDVLCGLCGHRYLGPRDEDKHGYGKCD